MRVPVPAGQSLHRGTAGGARHGEADAIRRLGDYGRCAGFIAASLRSAVYYGWTDESGSTCRSELYHLMEEGDDRNVDGCVLEVLAAVTKGLET